MDLSKWFVSIFSLPALLVVVRLVPKYMADVFSIVGRFSLSIYLMNMIFIGLARAILMKFMNWNGSSFLIFFVILLTAGIIGPLLIKMYMQDRFKRVSAYV